jgi:hypothetical protein
MLNSSLTDFYRGWMIEIVSIEEGFQSICRSPVGEKLRDYGIYPHLNQAWRSGIVMIDQTIARCALKNFLRESYEAGRLEFGEWQLLSQSLNYRLA